MFEPKNHFFKIDKKILSLKEDALDKKTVLEYLLHCRRANPQKNLGCSLSGARNAYKLLGLDKETWQLANKELEEKFLIKKRPEVGTGFLKTIAIEVLAFPLYDRAINKFNLDKTKEHNHRTYKTPGQYINVPSIIIDKGYLKYMILAEIYALLWLYYKIDLINYYGVDFHLIHKYVKKNNGLKSFRKFGDGFFKEIHGRWCAEVLSPRTQHVEDNKYQGDFLEVVDDLVQKDLFKWIPVLVWEDPEDKDIKVIKEEIFPGIIESFDTEGNMYLFEEPEKDHRVIWILKPTYPVITPEYTAYVKRQCAQRAYAFNRYNWYDVRTDNKTKKEYILDQNFQEFIEIYKFENIDEIRQCYEDEVAAEKIIEILPENIYRAFEKYMEYKLQYRY
jgi:hypothetical protein